MPHVIRDDFDSLDLLRYARLKLTIVDEEVALYPGRARKENFHRGHQPVANAGRPHDGERSSAAADQLRVEDEERQPAKVIAVKMANKYSADRVRIDAEFAQGDHRRRAAIDQKRIGRAAHVEAGMEASTAAESVARSQKLHIHWKPRRAAEPPPMHSQTATHWLRAEIE